MLIDAARRGFGGVAAEAAVLLSERGLGGNEPDLEARWRRWKSDRSPRAEGARGMARRWAKRAGASRSNSGEALALAVALAFPDRLARRRDSSGESWQSVGGRGFRLDTASFLARSEWLAVAEVAGHASGARILSAAAIEQASVLDLFGDKIEERHETRFDLATGAVLTTRSRMLGAIRLSSGADRNPDPEAVEAALLAGVREHGLALLPWDEATLALRERTAFAHPFDPAIQALTDDYLLDRLTDWLAPLLAGRRKLAGIAPAALRSSVEALLPYEAMRALAHLAPPNFVSPAGSRHPIDYGADSGPTAEVRAQALFGLAEHPMLAGGRVPLTLAITSPAGRPIQTSRDLPSFWCGSWRDVAKEMRGRYPKHAWPDDPATAAPTLKTKRATRG
jgi:ATP-dependent helicase HrpB